MCFAVMPKLPREHTAIYNCSRANPELRSELGHRQRKIRYVSRQTESGPQRSVRRWRLPAVLTRWWLDRGGRSLPPERVDAKFVPWRPRASCRRIWHVILAAGTGGYLRTSRGPLGRGRAQANDKHGHGGHKCRRRGGKEELGGAPAERQDDATEHRADDRADTANTQRPADAGGANGGRIVACRQHVHAELRADDEEAGQSDDGHDQTGR